MLVSVIVCTRNRAASLRRTLQSIALAANKVTRGWELIIVDNGSSDNTPDVVESFRDLLPIRIVKQPIPGLSNARNAGVSESKGEFILWTDDDVLVDEMWLQNWFRAFCEHDEIAVFGGRATPVYEEPVQDWFRLQEEELKYLLAIRSAPDRSEIVDPELPFGLNYAVRGAEQRDTLYNPELGVAPGRRRGGEEVDLIRRVLESGERGLWVGDAVVYHLISAERQSEAYIKNYYTTAGYYNPLRGYEFGRFLSRSGLYVAAHTFLRASLSYWKLRRKNLADSVPALILKSRAEGSLRHYLRIGLR